MALVYQLRLAHSFLHLKRWENQFFAWQIIFLPEGLAAPAAGAHGDVSIFMKELKQRFSIQYNRTHGRFGTLWAERFRSVLIEGRPLALQTVAAYIDLTSISHFAI